MDTLGQPDLKAIHARAEGWLEHWWDLWQCLEEHILSTIMLGPRNDPDACRLRPRFFGLLRDSFTAIEFVSEILMDRQRRAHAGTLLNDELVAMEVHEVVQRLASASWLRKRALSFAALRDTGGVGGLPSDVRSVGSLDAGEDFSLQDSIPAPGVVDDIRVESLDQTRALLEGVRLLRLDIQDTKPLTAIQETAAMQCWPRLDPNASVFSWISSSLGTRVVGGIAELDLSHAQARSRLQDEHDRCVTELIDHPGMAANTREEVRRRQYKAIVRLLLEPLDAAQLQTLLGLPSFNAADKRNSNYRRARAQLFPALYAEYLEVEEDL